jgi:lipopolysaccharide/colanic/teichoic acid biosynthesis glycosyltransferase
VVIDSNVDFIYSFKCYVWSFGAGSLATFRDFMRHWPFRAVPSNKRDTCVAAFCLVFFAPLTAIIYFLLRIEGKAVFTVQQRVREDGTSYNVWRFRTAGLGEKPVGMRANSARRRLLTRVGAFLRWSRLEVLPTFYNVFRGDINLQEMLREI